MFKKMINGKSLLFCMYSYLTTYQILIGNLEFSQQFEQRSSRTGAERQVWYGDSEGNFKQLMMIDE